MSIKNYDNCITTVDLMKFDLHNAENQHIVEWLPEPIGGVVASFYTEGCPLIGDVVQILPEDTTTTDLVDAPECPYYHFLDWTCDNGYTTPNHDIVLTGIDHNVNCTAHYTKNTHTVIFVIGGYYYYYYSAFGYLVGDEHQIVYHMEDCTSVTAVPYPGHTFRYWNKGNSFYSYDATITPTDIDSDQVYTAFFT